MTPQFALLLSHEGLSLLMSASDGWRSVGHVGFDSETLQADLLSLRDKGRGLTGDALIAGGLPCKLVIPDDQIRYLTVESVPGTDIRATAAVALDGATPYAVEELAFDLSATGAAIHVAAVAQETLLEAETFAEAHGFAPLFCVAAPADTAFAQEPFFGPSRFSETHKIAVAAAHTAPVVDQGRVEDAPLPSPVAPIPKNSAPEDPAPQNAESESAALDQTGPQQEGPEPSVSDQSIPDQSSEAAADITAEVAPQGENVATKLTIPSAPETADAPVKTPLPLGVDVQVFNDQNTEVEGPAVGFSSRRRGQSDGPAIGTPQPIAAPTVSGAMPIAAAVTAPAANRTSLPAAPNLEAPSQFTRRNAAGATAASTQDPVHDPVEVAKQAAAASGAVEAAGKASGKTAVPEAMAAALSATLKQDGRSKGASIAGAKHKSGRKIAVAALLLSTGIGAALWLLPTLWAPEDQTATIEAPSAADTSSTDALTLESATATGEAETPPALIRPTERASELTGPSFQNSLTADAAKMPQDLSIAALPAPKILPAQPQTAALPKLNEEARPQEDWTGTAVALGDPFVSGDPVDKLAPPTPAELSKAAQYAATGIWQEVPRIGDLPRLVSLGAVNVPTIDPSSNTQAAAVLPVQTAIATDETPLSPAAQQPLDGPAAEGAAPATVADTAAQALAALEPELDERGLVIATAEGTITPDGVRVVRGRPEFVPPAVPDRLDEDALAAQQAAEDRAELGRLRPRVRPFTPEQEAIEDDAAAPVDDDANAEETADEAEAPVLRADVRPRQRPTRFAAIAASLAEAQEANDREGSRSAPTTRIATLRPRNRPSNIAAIADRAQRRQAATAAIAAAATSAPAIPSSASVARQATQSDVLNLRRVNLIGVYGTASNRRALVRLPSGRYVKVKVGDRIDGGKIVAIGEEQLRYQKGGRNTTLKMPSS